MGVLICLLTPSLQRAVLRHPVRALSTGAVTKTKGKRSPSGAGGTDYGTGNRVVALLGWGPSARPWGPDSGGLGGCVLCVQER